MSDRQEIIRASEIGEFVYCARAWWLRRVAGEEPEGADRRAHGARLHLRHGRAVALSGSLLWAAGLLLLVGLALVLLG